MARRRWDPTCSHQKGTPTIYTHICRDYCTADESKHTALYGISMLTFLQPENHHVRFNVDVKVQNDPDRLFRLMHAVISGQPEWETKLAPRILLGLWHPRFVAYAKSRLPYCRRSYIGVSTTMARKYFWDDVEVFSIAFSTLAGSDGLK